MRRILIIEPNWLGDILFTTPAIRALREKNTEAFIACMVHPRCAQLLEDNPGINEIILFDEKSLNRSILSKIIFIKKLRRYRFDTVISFQRSMTRMLIAYLSGISRRAGYYTKKRSWLLTDKVSLKDPNVHRVEYFLDIIRALGIDTDKRDYQFNIPEDIAEKTDNILQDAGIGIDDKLIVLNPGGNWPPKRWPKENYAKACKELDRLYRKKIVLTGALKDKELAEEIIRLSSTRAINMCGRTTLKELAAIMRRASLVIANDSGPMHIAVSQKAPTIAIFGPTSKEITGPYGESGRYIVLQKQTGCEIPCYAECEDYRCMDAVKVDDVIQAAKGLMA